MDRRRTSATDAYIPILALDSSASIHGLGGGNMLLVALGLTPTLQTWLIVNSLFDPPDLGRSLLDLVHNLVAPVQTLEVVDIVRRLQIRQRQLSFFLFSIAKKKNVTSFCAFFHDYREESILIVEVTLLPK